MLVPRSGRAIVRVEGITRLIVATFRGRPTRAINRIGTAASFGLGFDQRVGEEGIG